MNYSNLQLQNKTFLDFTTDPSVIEAVLGASDVTTINRFKQKSKNTGVRAATFMEYAHIIHDDKLISVIRSEYADYFSSLIVD